MSRARTARRIAAAAAYGGGGLGLLGAATAGLLVAEAKLARRTIGEPEEDPPAAEGTYGHGPGPTLTLAMVGDSSAAGLGVAEGRNTPGAVIATGLAAMSGRRVRLVNVAKSGATSRDLADQVARARAEAPHVTVVMIGANDVTHRVPLSESVRLLGDAVRSLREDDGAVVVGTCPDLGTIEPVGQPLRLVARRLSRQLAAAQTIAVVEAGGRSVSLGDVLGPEFAAAPREMFSADRFHPSEAGYARAAACLLPSVVSVLGLWPGDREPVPDVHRGEGVRPVAVAAAQAAASAGTEVAAARVSGQDRGPRGRWALLRRRGGEVAPVAAGPAADGPEPSEQQAKGTQVLDGG